MFQVNDLVKLNPDADTVPDVLVESFSDKVGKVIAVGRFYPNVSVQFGYRDERRYAFVEEELVSAV